MNWTTEYPAQPGYYWLRNYVFWRKDFSGPDVVSLESEGSDLKVCFTGDDDGYALSKFTSAEWFGPIQPPQENDDYEWNDETGCSFAKSWCSAKATHGDLCDHHWKWEQVYKKREAKVRENDK